MIKLFQNVQRKKEVKFLTENMAMSVMQGGGGAHVNVQHRKLVFLVVLEQAYAILFHFNRCAYLLETDKPY